MQVSRYCLDIEIDAYNKIADYYDLKSKSFYLETISISEQNRFEIEIILLRYIKTILILIILIIIFRANNFNKTILI